MALYQALWGRCHFQKRICCTYEHFLWKWAARHSFV